MESSIGRMDLRKTNSISSETSLRNVTAYEKMELKKCVFEVEIFWVEVVGQKNESCCVVFVMCLIATLDVLTFDVLTFDVLTFDVLTFDVLTFDVLTFDGLTFFTCEIGGGGGVESSRSKSSSPSNVS